MDKSAYENACNLIEIGRLDEAEIILKEIIKMDNNDYLVINKLGVVFANKGLLDNAGEYFIKALEINSDYVPAIVNMGNIYKEKKQYEDALKYYICSIQLDPKYYYAYYNIAILYKETNNYEKYLSYIKEYKKAFKLYTKENKKNNRNKMTIFDRGPSTIGNSLPGITYWLKKFKHLYKMQ